MTIDYSKFANIDDSDDEQDRKKARADKDKDIKGQLVEAHGLTGAAQLNGLIGRVVNRQGDRIGVDFGKPHGCKALKPANIRSVSPGTAARRTQEQIEKEQRERKEWEGRSRPSRQEEKDTTEEEEDDEDVGNWYRHREWKPAKETAAPAAAPIKLAAPPAPPPSTTAAGSAWNTAGTWEEKDVMPWAKGRLAELLTGLSEDLAGLPQGGSVRFTSAEVTGDCSVGFIRGKKRYLFDMAIEAKWEAQIPGTGAAGTDGALKGSGTVSISEFDQSEDPPFTMDFALKDGLSASPDAQRAVREAVGATREAVQHGRGLCAKLHDAILRWKEEYHKL